VSIFSKIDTYGLNEMKPNNSTARRLKMPPFKCLRCIAAFLTAEAPRTQRSSQRESWDRVQPLHLIVMPERN